MGSTLIPVLRYRDCPKAIDWLERAFDFQRHFVVEGDAGDIQHAQMIFGSGMLMLGTVREGDRLPLDGEDKPTGFYVVVDDVDTHAARAREAGAKITVEPFDEDYGGRAYACLDLEGYGWYFGSYDPWAAVSQ